MKEKINNLTYTREFILTEEEREVTIGVSRGGSMMFIYEVLERGFPLEIEIPMNKETLLKLGNFLIQTANEN